MLSLSDHRPDNDLLPDDLPFDVVGAIAGLYFAIQPVARMRRWLDEGDVSTLISMYYTIAGDDSLPGPNREPRAFLTPHVRSPHESIRLAAATMAEKHGFDLLATADS